MSESGKCRKSPYLNNLHSTWLTPLLVSDWLQTITFTTNKLEGRTYLWLISLYHQFHNLLELQEPMCAIIPPCRVRNNNNILTCDVISKNCFRICFCLDALRTAFRFNDLFKWIPKNNMIAILKYASFHTVDAALSVFLSEHCVVSKVITSVQSVVFQPRHRPTVVLLLVYCPVGNTLTQAHGRFTTRLLSCW